MPFAGFKDFAACLAAQRRRGLSEIEARKVCGRLQAEAELSTLAIRLPDGDPPSEFRIFKAGKNTSTKGPVLFDDEAARSVMHEFDSHGIDLMIDLEHLSLDDEAPNFDPDARGWATLEIRNGELWAVGVKWTDDGAARLNSKKQRFISPAFKRDIENKRVVQLVNVAITSLPATDRLVPLVAARGQPQKRNEHMDPELLQALGLAEGATIADVLQVIAAMKEAAESAAAKLAEHPEDEQEEERLIAASARKATGKTKPGEVAAVLVALKSTGTTTATLAGEVEQLRADVQKRDVRDMVKDNLAKIPPTLETWALDQTVETLTAFLDKAPEVRSAKTPIEKVKTPADAITLTAEDRWMCEQFGNKPADVLKFKQDAAKAEALAAGTE